MAASKTALAANRLEKVEVMKGPSENEFVCFSIAGVAPRIIIEVRGIDQVGIVCLSCLLMPPSTPGRILYPGIILYSPAG